MRTEPCTFLPIHEITESLGREIWLLLTLFHASTGKDDTTFLYVTVKNTMEAVSTGKVKSTKHISREFWLTNSKWRFSFRVCKSLVIRASNSGEDSLASLRTKKFLATKYVLLLSLPLTEDALEQHTKRAAF